MRGFEEIEISPAVEVTVNSKEERLLFGFRPRIRPQEPVYFTGLLNVSTDLWRKGHSLCYSDVLGALINDVHLGSGIRLPVISLTGIVALDGDTVSNPERIC